jgi:hypothetical protein
MVQSIRARKEFNRLTDEELLQMRFCDLSLSLESGPLKHRISILYEELEEHGLRFKPHIWLSEEWFTPDEVPGFAIPFYLAHPRLARLERKQMLEVEGGTKRDCLRIMRHEAGHAFDNAYRLHSRRRYRELFGAFSSPYPNWYKPKPTSRDFVLNLPAWYAQAHPAEDFAETFAVWLRGIGWKRHYAGWPALKKVEYIDELMKEVSRRAPLNKSRERVEELSEIKTTLFDHYQRKREHYAFRWPPDYDRALKRIFVSESNHNSAPAAAGFLSRHRRELCHEVAEGTGAHHYAIDQMLSHMINRCRELKLKVDPAQDRTWQMVLVSLTIQTMNGILSGYHRIAL